MNGRTWGVCEDHLKTEPPKIEAEGTGTNASHAASDRKLTMAEARELADETGKMLNFRQQTTVLREFKADSYEDLTQGNWRTFIARVQQVAEGK